MSDKKKILENHASILYFARVLFRFIWWMQATPGIVLAIVTDHLFVSTITVWLFKTQPMLKLTKNNAKYN